MVGRGRGRDGCCVGRLGEMRGGGEGMVSAERKQGGRRNEGNERRSQSWRRSRSVGFGLSLLLGHLVVAIIRWSAELNWVEWKGARG